jgi:hypothetical protein
VIGRVTLDWHVVRSGHLTCFGCVGNPDQLCGRWVTRLCILVDLDRGDACHSVSFTLKVLDSWKCR